MKGRIERKNIQSRKKKKEGRQEGRKEERKERALKWVKE